MEIRPFEFTIGEREMSATLGKTACVLFRSQQEVDYLAINTTEEGDEDRTVLRIFNNVKLVRWLAGFAFHEDGVGLTTDDGRTFYDEYGWRPPTIVKHAPNEEELGWFMDVNAGKIDQEWQEME